MEVINWVAEMPTGQEEPAAKGKVLNGLVVVKVYWRNAKGYFEATLTGNTCVVLPEHFDTLKFAKEYAEKETLSWLLAATEEQSAFDIIVKVTAPGNRAAIKKIPMTFNFETVKAQAKSGVGTLIESLSRGLQFGSGD